MQAIIPEFPSPRDCSRNSKDPLADDARSCFCVVAVNRMQQSNE